MDLSPTYLSQVINREFQLNFRDFLNSVRVTSARKLLEDPGRRETPVVQIGFDVGFNSASVFYAAFRKFTGTTPLNYRNRHLRHVSES
jgi:AraC-like DNA-binding protein